MDGPDDVDSAEDLEEEELDEEELDDVDDLPEEDAVVEGDDDEDDEDDEDEAPATARRKAGEDEDDEDEDLDPDDVEADLDAILKDRIAAGDEDEDEDEAAPEERSDPDNPERVAAKSAEEFTCSTCFMIVHPRQFGRLGQLTCPEGYDPCPSVGKVEKRLKKAAKK